MITRADGRGRRLSRALRLAACLLLATIIADLAADTKCDAFQTGTVTATVVSGPIRGQPDDHRPPFCIPDCFCCSRWLVAGPALLPPEPVPLMPLDPRARESCSDGVRPVIDHPPLSRA